MSGRWHTRGSRVVYCAPNPATSLVEVLVHSEIDSEDLIDPLRYLEIEAPDAVGTEQVDTRTFGRAWQTNIEASRRAGDEWLRSERSALLRVPSVLLPATWNILINPRHPDSRGVRVVRVHVHATDPRLVR